MADAPTLKLVRTAPEEPVRRPARRSARQPRRVVSIGGGKGGIGKSLISANLGIELARRLRERSDIPIIIYTGRDRGELETVAHDVGIDEIVSKNAGTLSYERLSSSVREVVEKHVLGLLKILA